MLDIHTLRERPDEARANLARRKDEAKLRLLNDVVGWDRAWREALQELEARRRRRNDVSKEIAQRKKQGKDAKDLLQEAGRLPAEIGALEARVTDLEANVRGGLMRLPNLLHPAVPEGKDDTENRELRRWGEPRTPSFPLKPHGEWLEAAGLVDFERAGKVAGAGFLYLRGDLVRLDLALVQLALDDLTRLGYTPIEPPFLLRRRPYEGVVDLADFESVMYKIEGEDLYLIATSEHPIGAMFLDEVIDEDLLPMRFCGVSTNFRREIGAHGVDTKGLFRMHQFNKVEQFVFCRPEESAAMHEELIANAERLFQLMGIPYRVVEVCTGDIGAVAARKFDLEAWSPRQGKYVEVVSCSNCTDYQARRLNIRCGKIGGEKRVPHSLNSTAIATSRALVAIVENFQEEDGSVTVPRALRPYMAGIESLRPSKTSKA